MKLPSWYQLEIVDKHKYRITIRWWHPGFLWEAYRTLRESGAGVLSSLYFMIVLAKQMAKRK